MKKKVAEPKEGDSVRSLTERAENAEKENVGCP